MREIILYIATSIDGYIAKTDGDTSWLHAPEFTLKGEDYGYKKLIDSIDTIIMGHNTLKVIDGFDMPFPYTSTKNYVFSRTPKLAHDHVEFVNENITEFVRKLKEVPGKHIWLVGGSEINGALLSKKLIDRIVLTIIPRVLGKGIPLFNDADIDSTFKLGDHKAYANGLIQLTYLHD